MDCSESFIDNRYADINLDGCVSLVKYVSV